MCALRHPVLVSNYAEWLFLVSRLHRVYSHRSDNSRDLDDSMDAPLRDLGRVELPSQLDRYFNTVFSASQLWS